MKSLITVFILAAVVAGIVACDPIEGTLQVARPFSATAGKAVQSCPDYQYPCDNTEESISVSPGSYGMKVEMSDGETIQLDLKIGRDHKYIYLHAPRGNQIPETGDFTLSSQQTGQPFDLQGRSQTNVTYSDETRGQESCQVPVQEQVCGNKGNPAKYTCWFETRYRPGLQDVAYYFKYTHQDMNAQIIQSGLAAAQFQGSRDASDKIYNYRGPCYIRGY